VKIRGLSCEAIRVWGTEIDLGLKSSDLRREGKWNRLGIWDLGFGWIDFEFEAWTVCDLGLTNMVEGETKREACVWKGWSVWINFSLSN
jgi:hypothetical protein